MGEIIAEFQILDLASLYLNAAYNYLTVSHVVEDNDLQATRTISEAHGRVR